MILSKVVFWKEDVLSVAAERSGRQGMKCSLAGTAGAGKVVNISERCQARAGARTAVCSALKEQKLGALPKAWLRQGGDMAAARRQIPATGTGAWEGHLFRRYCADLVVEMGVE